MNLPLGIVLIFCFSAYCLCDPLYFDCYKDKCERGLQYCVHKINQRRCFFCEEKANECGTETMPRDCDSYCTGLKLRKAQDDLESTISEKIGLEESIQLLNKSLVVTSMKLEEFKAVNSHLLRENNELSLTLNATKGNAIILHTNYTELYNKNSKLESDLKDCEEEVFRIVIVASVGGAIVLVFSVIALYMCVRRRLKKGKRYSNVPVGTGEETAMVKKPHTEGSNKIKRAPSADSAVNLSDTSSNITMDTSDAESGEPSGNDKSLVVKTRGEHAVAYKCDETNQRAEPSVGRCGDQPAEFAVVERNQNANTERGDCDEEKDTCLKKDTPAALKGIPPTSSQLNLSQKMYS